MTGLSIVLGKKRKGSEKEEGGKRGGGGGGEGAINTLIAHECNNTQQTHVVSRGGKWSYR